MAIGMYEWIKIYWRRMSVAIAQLLNLVFLLATRLKQGG